MAELKIAYSDAQIRALIADGESRQWFRVAENPTATTDAYAGETGLKDPSSVILVGDNYACYVSMFEEDPIGIVRGKSLEQASYRGEEIPAGSGWDLNRFAPDALVESGTYYVFYTGRTALGATLWEIGLVTSNLYTGGVWAAHANNPLLTAGAVGEWDEKKVYDPSVLYCDPGITQVAAQWVMWYAGCDLPNVRRIGLATADDPGGPWTKYSGNPVLIGNEVAGQGIESPRVWKCNRTGYFHMMTSGCSYVNPNYRNIGHFTSLDGITWYELAPALIAPSAETTSGMWDSNNAGAPGIYQDPHGHTKIIYQGKDALDVWRLGVATEGQRDGVLLRVAGGVTDSDPTQLPQWPILHRDSTDQVQMVATKHYAGVVGPTKEFHSSRGTRTDRDAVQVGDEVGGHLYRAHDGTDYDEVGSALMLVEAIAAGNIAAYYLLRAANAAGTVQTLMHGSGVMRSEGFNGAPVSAHADLWAVGNGCLGMTETTTPTADADHAKIYAKADNKLYFQDGAGIEHEVALVP